MKHGTSFNGKAFKLNYSTPTNNNQRISSNPRNRQIAQPGMNMGQDRQMRMVGGNGRNQFRQYAGQNGGYQNGLIALKMSDSAARAEGNATGNNGNQIGVTTDRIAVILLGNVQSDMGEGCVIFRLIVDCSKGKKQESNSKLMSLIWMAAASRP
ncbi:hypothetical protein Tco_0826414 [Tanacetum coccineum]